MVAYSGLGDTARVAKKVIQMIEKHTWEKLHLCVDLSLERALLLANLFHYMVMVVQIFVSTFMYNLIFVATTWFDELWGEK